MLQPIWSKHLKTLTWTQAHRLSHDNVPETALKHIIEKKYSCFSDLWYLVSFIIWVMNPITKSELVESQITFHKGQA